MARWARVRTCQWTCSRPLRLAAVGAPRRFLPTDRPPLRAIGMRTVHHEVGWRRQEEPEAPARRRRRRLPPQHPALGHRAPRRRRARRGEGRAQDGARGCRRIVRVHDQGPVPHLGRAFRREGACNTERAPCPHPSPPPPQVLKPAGQGPDGDPVLLFFDGHTSRWNMSALLYMERNNVHGICLPSHTSIWSQPNDAGANASFKAFFGVTLRQTRTNAQASANRAVFDTVHWPPASARVCTPRLFFFNTVIVRLTIRTPVLYMQAFRRAFIGWRHKLEEGLRSSKACNAIKSAWKTVRCVFQAAQLARAVPPRIPHRPCPPLLLLAADPHSSRSAAEPALHRAPRDRPSFRSPSSAPSPPSARQVGLGGRLNRQCDSWRDAIIAFGRLPHVPGSSDAEAAHDPAGDAAAPGTSVWEQAQQAAADRLRTRLSALVAGKSLQLRRVVLDSGGDGVDDYIPSASAATAVGLAEG